MNIHKNARLSFARRLELVTDVLERRVPLTQAAVRHGVSNPTARKWLGRFLTQGPAGLRDASSRPRRSPRAIPPQQALAIVELRRRRLTQAAIARRLGVSESTVSRVVKRAGLSKLSALDPVEPVVRYEHAAPGELIHIDIKKLGRIVRTGHRITRNRRDSVEGAGWEYMFVAVDDHARIAFTQIKPDERQDSAIAFLHAMVEYFRKLGVRVRRVLSDNGPAFHSRRFVQACRRLGVKQVFTRPYRPQTNGKAERFIQSALREWAYGIAYRQSAERAAMLERWTHHYNWHRPHQGIAGVAPMSRLKQPRNNLLTLHSSYGRTVSSWGSRMSGRSGDATRTLQRR